MDLTRSALALLLALWSAARAEELRIPRSDLVLTVPAGWTHAETNDSRSGEHIGYHLSGPVGPRGNPISLFIAVACHPAALTFAGSIARTREIAEKNRADGNTDTVVSECATSDRAYVTVVDQSDAHQYSVHRHGVYASPERVVEVQCIVSGSPKDKRAQSAGESAMTKALAGFRVEGKSIFIPKPKLVKEAEARRGAGEKLAPD